MFLTRYDGAADLIEVALERELILRPDPFERANEFLGTTIALVMVEPWFADGPELTAEPAADNVDGCAAACQLVQGGELLRGLPGRVCNNREPPLELGAPGNRSGGAISADKARPGVGAIAPDEGTCRLPPAQTLYSQRSPITTVSPGWIGKSRLARILVIAVPCGR